MLEILNNLKFIFNNSQIKKTFLLLFVVLISVLLEMLGIGVLIPIITVSLSFFEDTSNYYQILKDTLLF